MLAGAMHVIKAIVRNGRSVIDEPTSLPAGHEVELRVINDDEMGEHERRELHASIARGVRDGLDGRELELDAFLDQIDSET